MIRYLQNSLITSWPRRIFGLVAFIFGVFILTANAQPTTAEVRVSLNTNSQILIEINLASQQNSWSFRNAFAGAVGLGERIKEFQGYRAGKTISVNKLATGEFRSVEKADRITYVLETPLQRPADLAHISWLTQESGLFMLGDLLPESIGAISIGFGLPEGWVVESSLDYDKKGVYYSEHPEECVFFVGQRLRNVSKSVQGMDLRISIQGSWPFDDEKVLKSAAKLMEFYSNLTNFKLRKRTAVFIVPMPAGVSSQWKAETRGSTVVLLLNPQAGFRNWSAQLGVIFTHEILHLWVPNSLNLTGDYDWFFEGFTLYVALQAALKLKLIDFKEYLNTLGRVYDSYLSYSENATLIEASERRWTTLTPVVYDKGMLVAFLYDLTIRLKSDGKSSLEDVYHLLFARNPAEPGEGNDVIIKLLGASPATKDFSTAYIESRSKVDLQQAVVQFGLDVNSSGATTKVSVRNQLTPNQQNLLRSLGYRK